MSNTPHELAEEFPGEIGKIRALRETDAHFARLVDEYHEVNGKVHRVETRVEAASVEHEAELRHRRVKLKDEIARLLSAA